MKNLPRLSESNYEANRLRALRSYNILDTLTEEDYEHITYLASTICEVPIAVISFVDEKRQWFKSRLGLEPAETHRDYSFCAHAINTPQEFLIVENAHEDDRFKNNPLVTGDPNIVFYAGVPLISEEGYGLGTVCVIVNQPRQLSEGQLKSLRILSSHVMSLLETRRSNAELEKTRYELECRNRELSLSENLLAKSEERLRKMSEGADVLVAVRDEDNEYTFITKGWSDFTGKSTDELMLFGWKELIHPDDRGKFVDLFLEAFENRSPYSVEFRMLNASQEYVWLLTQGSPEFRADGSFSGFISSTVNIASLKEIENEFDKKSKTLEFTLAAGKLGSYDMNVKSGIMHTSSRYNQNLALEAEQQLSLSSLLALIVTEDKSLLNKAFATAIKERTAYEVEYRISAPGGEVVWIRDSGIPLYDEAGEVIKISGITMNVTEQKRLFSELERKAKDRPAELLSRFSNLENMMR